MSASDKEKGQERAERRSQPRIPVRSGARLRLMRGSEAALRPMQGKVVNVSAGGLCVEAGAEVRPGDILKIEFSVPEFDTVITALVEVTWSGADGRAHVVGGRYVAIRPDEVRLLATFIEKSRPQPPP